MRSRGARPSSTHPSRRRSVPLKPRGGEARRSSAGGAAAAADELLLGPAAFSRATGALTRLGGLPVDDLRLVLWRAPTDNDHGVDWWGNPEAPTLAQRWVGAGLNRLHSRLIGITAVAGCGRRRGAGDPDARRYRGQAVRGVRGLHVDQRR